MSTRLYPEEIICKNFQVKSSYVSGISLKIRMQAIKSTIYYAATESFGGWQSLGCFIGSLHPYVMICINLDFAVTLQEPSGLAKLIGTAHNG